MSTISLLYKRRVFEYIKDRGDQNKRKNGFEVGYEEGPRQKQLLIHGIQRRKKLFLPSPSHAIIPYQCSDSFNPIRSSCRNRNQTNQSAHRLLPCRYDIVLLPSQFIDQSEARI